MQKRGEEILDEFLKRNSLELTFSVLDKLCSLHEIDKHEQLLQALGEKNIILGDQDLHELLGKGKKKEETTKGWLRYVPFLGKQKKGEKAKDNANAPADYMVLPEDFNKKKPIYITDENIHQFVFKSCCHPIPGDDVLGYIDGKNHIEIHKRSCRVASKLKSSYGNRILDAKWDMHKHLLFDATLSIRGIDRIGMLNEVTNLISEHFDVNIHKLTISCDEGIFSGVFELLIHDRADLEKIIKGLKTIKGVQEVNQTV